MRKRFLCMFSKKNLTNKYSIWPHNQFTSVQTQKSWNQNFKFKCTKYFRDDLTLVFDDAQCLNSISEPSSEIWKTRFILIWHCREQRNVAYSIMFIWLVLLEYSRNNEIGLEKRLRFHTIRLKRKKSTWYNYRLCMHGAGIELHLFMPVTWSLREGNW